MDKKKHCDDMVDYLFKDIIKDIEYVYKGEGLDEE